ncbi:BrnA antitoxin family protein [Chromatium okenii]|uniref:BrnA antitoxin family protein n=1 Tax=Chromatium okenii TaxID=61644 RepID=UPI0026ECE263|nr:BrnA antitoxin family protein [Chromatium okenii]MBV5309935.1 BrnA antitoxin family protein [Chromatium okenii]
MPKLKPGTIIPTPEEDAVITAAAMSDPDAIPFTDEEWDAIKPFVRIGCPLQSSATIQIDADVLVALKALGDDWEQRINEVLRNYVATINHL